MPAAEYSVSKKQVSRSRRSPDAGERAYAYAKACGIIGKSFVGKRIFLLGKLNTLAQMSRLVFPELQLELPERELLTELEKRILKRTTNQILSVLNSYSNPPEFLVRQLRAAEYADLKICLHHISNGKPAPEMLNDIGRFRTVRFELYPDIEAMISGTEFNFILNYDLSAVKKPDYDYTPLDTELDVRYYSLLLNSMSHLSASDRHFAEWILAEEISLRNCAWVLRLRTYYNKKPDETVKYLMDMKMFRSFLSGKYSDIPGDIHPRIATLLFGKEASDKDIHLALEAKQMLNFPLNSRSAWNGWRWESLLNPEIPGEVWNADPRYFQNAASRYIYHLAWRCFTRLPLSMDSIFCFIQLKQFEEDILTGIAEGLRLGMDGKETLEFLGVSQ